MVKLVMCKGLPASGKTTWAKQVLDGAWPDKTEKWKRVNKDDLRAMMDNGKWSKANEKFVLAARDRLIALALHEGYNVICDDTNLAPRHEQQLRSIASICGAEFEVKDFANVSLEECIERDRKRPNYVGEHVIRRMFCQYMMPKPVRQNVSLPHTILCDIDGTLAIHNGRDPYDTAKCEDDLLNEAVEDILHIYAGFYEGGALYPIILLSGREEQYREQTERWLRNYDVPCTHLFMRPTGDMRKDSIIKREIYEREIKDKYYVDFVLDDRDQVVNFWRCELGLTCLQVNYGAF